MVYTMHANRSEGLAKFVLCNTVFSLENANTLQPSPREQSDLCLYKSAVMWYKH